MRKSLAILVGVAALSSIGVSAAAACTTPAPRPTMSDKGWSVVPGTLAVHPDFTGDFGGSVRITNRTGSTQSASFTITALRGTRQLGSMMGVVSSVRRGQTVTVQLISSDNYVAATRFAFQTDYSF